VVGVVTGTVAIVVGVGRVVTVVPPPPLLEGRVVGGAVVPGLPVVVVVVAGTVLGTVVACEALAK
jgi:hypothetical protein